MPKYWGGNYFAHGSFPEVGQKQKTEEKKREKRRRKKRKLANNGHMSSYAWRTQAAWAKIKHLYCAWQEATKKGWPAVAA